jgi:ABC-2 type transport system ATP-binding protein
MVDSIKIENLSKVYKLKSGDKIALDNVSLSVKENSFFALLGPNGAGKSTMINILSSLVIKNSGKVIVNGFDLDLNLKNVKRSLGIVPQEIYFDPFFTAIEYLMINQGLFGVKPNRKSAMDLLETMGIADKADSMTRALSGGMKRRLLIAKALIHDPDIIILDEPTAGVDVDLRKHIWREMLKLKDKGKTIILTTHYLEEAQELCDEIAIINKGKLILQDTKNNIMEKMGEKSLEITLDKHFNEKDKNLIDYKILVDEKNKNIIKVEYKEQKDTGYIVAKLVEMGYFVNSFNTNSSNLEDIFLKLTK